MTVMRPGKILADTRHGQSRPVLDTAGQAPSASASEVSAERAAHSPGPWHIEGELTRRTLKDSRGRSIVVIERWTREEDARLIAAAPDMLAAIKEIRRRLKTPPTKEGEACWKQLNEAITKAEGRRE